MNHLIHWTYKSSILMLSRLKQISSQPGILDNKTFDYPDDLTDFCFIFPRKSLPLWDAYLIVMSPPTSLWNSFWLLLTAVWIAACSPPSPAPQSITVPLPNTVSGISVSVKGREQSKQLIQDRTAIERVIELLAENNSGWSKGLFTFPTPFASAVLSTGSGSAPVVIWFGPDWLGVAATVDGERGNYFWHVRPEVEFELRRLLDINVNKPRDQPITPPDTAMRQCSTGKFKC